MRKRPTDRFLAAVLAVLITVGMGLSPIQASAMSLKMDMADGMTGAMDDGCPDCLKDNAATGMKAVTCGIFCAIPILAVVPDSAPAAATPDRLTLTPARDPLLHGLRAAPDPHPPPEAAIV